MHALVAKTAYTRIKWFCPVINLTQVLNMCLWILLSSQTKS